jgi:hypothetical protein
MEFWHATTDAGRYTLEAFGETEADAVAALQLGIIAHATKAWDAYTNYDIESRKEYIEQMNADLSCEKRRMGAAYRDGAQL